MKLRSAVLVVLPASALPATVAFLTSPVQAAHCAGTGVATDTNGCTTGSLPVRPSACSAP